MTVHWTHDTITDHEKVTDGLGRRFTYHQGRFTYGGHYIHAADVEWPVTGGADQ